MSDSITITSDGLSAQIALLGAELRSLTDGGGRELMTDADPRWWTGHAPILFPIVGRLNGDRYRLGDRTFDLPQHGFARRRTFAIVEASEDRAVLRLEASDETRAVYPFAFRLDMAFALAGATLSMTATVANLGDVPMPFSFGYHPAFAWPLPYGGTAEDHRVLFEHDEPAPIRRIGEGGTIQADPVPSPVIGHELAPTHALFDHDALIWDRLNSRSLTWGVQGQPSLRIDFPDTPWLGLWQKPGAHYLCIEPWAGMADPAGFTGDFRDKPGVRTLPPGEAAHFRMIVTLIG